MPHAKKHVTNLKAPVHELGNGLWKISCNYDGDRIGEIGFSRGSIEITFKDGRKVTKKTGKIQWKDFFDKFL